MKVGLFGLRGKGVSFVTIVLMCSTVFIWTWKRTPVLSTFPPEGRLELTRDVWWSVPGRVEDEAAVATVKEVRKVETNDGGIRTDVKEKEMEGKSVLKETMREERNSEDTANEQIKNGNTRTEEKRSRRKGKKNGVDSKGRSSKTRKIKVCNYAKGKWVVDHNQTLYSGFGCNQWLSEMWSCRLTRRTDFAYENLRWQPKDCDLERFKESKFFKRMQNKTLAFVGDSLGRQQFQSLICMITRGRKQDDVIDVGEEYGIAKAQGQARPDGWAFRFPSTNTTVLYYWSASLCDIQPMNATNPDTDYAMHLDRPASFLTQNIHRINVLVLNTAHHWNRGKFKANRWVMHVGGTINTDRHLQQIWKARNLTVHSVVKWGSEQVSKYPNLQVFYRTISPRHFSGGEWNTGGSCDNTSPMSIGKEIVQDESSDHVAPSAVKGTRVKLLDITDLSSLRDEAHISRFRGPPNSTFSDCLHWCLPGVPDTWNEILSAQL